MSLLLESWRARTRTAELARERAERLDTVAELRAGRNGTLLVGLADGTALAVARERAARLRASLGL